MNNSFVSFLSLIQSICHQRDLVIEEKNYGFNIFNIMRMQSDEVRLHSTFLAELLNPKGTHYMGDLFLGEFLDRFTQMKSTWNISKTEVVIEKYIGEISEVGDEGGRLDIFLTDKTHSIIIENKIYATDQNKQLLRYYHYNKKAHIIYLTLDGHLPNAQSACELKNGKDYHCLSYAVNVLEWLEKCRDRIDNKPLFLNTLSQYINTIRELTHQSLIPTMDNVLSAAIRNNIQASIEIERVMPEIRNEFHAEFWNLLTTKLGVKPEKEIKNPLLWKSYDTIVCYPIEGAYKGEPLILRLRVSDESGIYLGITTSNEGLCKDDKFKQIIDEFSPEWKSENGSAHIVWKEVGLNFLRYDQSTISYMQLTEEKRKDYVNILAIEIEKTKNHLTNLCK